MTVNDMKVAKKLEEIDNKFALCIVLAKRAKDLNRRRSPMVSSSEDQKPTRAAFEDLAEGKIWIGQDV
jgi:DNA-directed RNA polymerase omega subunit